MLYVQRLAILYTVVIADHIKSSPSFAIPDV
jgi:hypothetical protein